MASTNFKVKNGLDISGTLVVSNGVGSNGQVLSSTGTGVQWVNASSGSGDVVGPASSTDNAIVRFDSTTGKLIQNSTATLSDGGIMIVTELDTDSIKSATANSPIVIAPDGTGDVHLNTDSVRIGDNNADATIATRGTGDLIITTNEGSAVEGIVRLYDGVNGDITLTPNGSGQVKVGTDQVVTLVASQTLTNKTLTSPTLTTPALGTPASGTLTNCTFPTLNQNTTGSAGSVANALTISSPLTGTSYNGSSAVSIGIPVATTSANGYLSSTDWTTFNNKGSGTVTSVTGTSPVVSSGGATPAISMAAATTSVNGYLTSTDWTTFNNKGSGSVTSVTGGTYLTGGTITTTGTLAVDATSANTASKVVARDASGNFSAGTITASLSGNATNVTGTVAVANGGTSLTTLTSGSYVVGAGTSAVTLKTPTQVTADLDTFTYQIGGTAGKKGLVPAAPAVGGPETIVYLDNSGGWSTPSAGGTTTNALTISSPLTGTSFNGSSAVSIGIPVATTSVNGYLSSTDWTTFNNKTSNTGTVTSVAGTGTVSGITLTGTVTGSGNLTLGGTISTLNQNTTGYAGYLNTTNQGLTGSTGLTTVSSTTAWSNYPIGYSAMFNAGQTATGAPSSNYGFFIKIANRDAGGGWGGIWTDYSGGDTYVGNTTVSSSYATWYKLLSSTNYNSYAPTLTGTGASGTWGISITGNASGSAGSVPASGITGSTLASGVTASSLTSVGTLTGLSVSGTINSTGAITQAGNQVLNAGNYSSYAFPLTGGGLNGDLNLGGNYLRFDQSGTRSWNMRATGGNLDLGSGDNGGEFRFKGNNILTAGNYSSYAIARGGDTVDGIIYFRSNKGNNVYLSNTNNMQLQAYSSDGGTAAMSFHRAGLYAVNFGLDPDNVLRLGGWSAPANVLQVNMSGDLTMLRYVFATDFNQSGGNSSNPTIGQIWTQNTSDNYCRKSTPAHFKSQLSLYSGVAGSGVITISQSAPSGGATNDIWLQW